MKLSKADPTGKERPLRSDRIRKVLIKNNFSHIEVYHHGFIAPLTVPFIRFKFLINILERVDRLFENTPLHRLCLRWTIHAKKG
ncbi:MAG: hypothetical protein KKE96_06390, partial [Candidatus Altiarchaeota archaeon]|nr:hypothetical protein [Candidatus Altiarchaeota archaeon]